MITSFDKAIVAVIMAGVFLANTFLNTNWSVDAATVNSIAAVLTPILVWLVPNKQPVAPVDSSKSGT